MKAGITSRKHNFQQAKHRYDTVFSVIPSFAFSILGDFSVGKCFQFYSRVVGKCLNLYKLGFIAKFPVACLSIKQEITGLHHPFKITVLCAIRRHSRHPATGLFILSPPLGCKFLKVGNLLFHSGFLTEYSAGTEYEPTLSCYYNE